ncbi:flagellar filament capping protein FliD [Pseudomonadota bacterium]|nr:flagellar filament capping protein FliD [Pseudomonadota bacterium]
MAIQAPGVGSGLDVNNIVSQLLDLERQPIDRLDSKQNIVNAQISAYGSLSSKISSFQDAMQKLSSPSEFKVFSSVSNDEDLFTTEVSSEASAGSYSVEVQVLAERDKIASKAYTDTETSVGEGTLTLSTGTDSFDVLIDGTNNTVEGIRDAVNTASDNTGITASIVTDDDGAHLVFSSDDTGTANALKVTVDDTSDGSNTDDSGLSSLAFEAGVVEHRPAISSALDSVVKIDGFTITSSSNTITGAVSGLSINAKAIGTSTIDVSRDDEKITESVQAFADAYNDLRTEIKTQRSGQLEADSTLLTLERQLSGVLNSGASVTDSSFSYLIEVGLSTDDTGTMSLDSSKLSDVLNTDFSSFVNLFSAEDEGIAFRLDNLADGFLGSGGLIEAREEGLQDQVDRIEDQKTRIEDRLISVERRIRAQFSALDTLVSNLSSTGNFLSEQLAALPGVSRS